jgi:site-specific DNA recombinase
VWNKQRKDEVLIDVDDVALGHTTKMRWNQADKWVWSEHAAHEPLIGAADFERAQAIMARRGRSRVGIPHRPHPTRRPYAYRGVLFCGYCDRRMQGNWNNDQAYYRCRFPAEYALANRVEHPKTVYLREAAILDEVDAWLAELFTSTQIERTIDALVDRGLDPDEGKADAVRKTIADCDRRLARYKAALDADADPVEVTRWINEAKADRARAEGQLHGLGGSKRMTREEITTMMTELGDLARVVVRADPGDKADLYREVGLKLTYRPQKQLVEAKVIPGLDMCDQYVSEGGLEPPCPVKGTSTSS